MQPGLFIEVLVLQSERLVRILVNPLIFFQTTPAGVVAKLQEIAVFIGHFSRDADLVAVEVVGSLSTFAVCGCPIADRYEGFVAVVL